MRTSRVELVPDISGFDRRKRSRFFRCQEIILAFLEVLINFVSNDIFSVSERAIVSHGVGIGGHRVARVNHVIASFSQLLGSRVVPQKGPQRAVRVAEIALLGI